MKKIYILLFTIFVVLIFRNWLTAYEIIGGDWPYFYEENIKAFNFLPPAWSSTQGNGLGGHILVYPLDSYLYFTGWLFSNIFKIPWTIAYRIFWFGMFIFLSGVSLFYLFKHILPKTLLPYRLLGTTLYLTNTYILMVVSGGQMGVALGYATAPLVLTRFLKLINILLIREKRDFRLKIKHSLSAGLVFAVQVMFDLRIAYITIAAVILYLLTNGYYNVLKRSKPNALSLILYSLIIPLCITGLMHAFWILPFLFIGQGSITELGAAYSTSEAVKFFSFAKLENTISLLHPNWPENIFGKIGFMKAEFLILPLLAYSSLFFISKNQDPRTKNYVLYFVLLGLTGAFLAKGANDPFGKIYLSLFDHIPGFVMFRDPTKWYTLVAISYSVLIPFSILSIYEWLKSKIKDQKSKTQIKYQKYSPIIFFLFTILYLIFLIHPAIFGQLGGTFRKHEVPSEYIKLKSLLYNDKDFYRTLWIPSQSRFTFSSSTHPAIEAGALFLATDAASLADKLKSKDAENLLSDLSIKYIIIPHDPYGEIFIEDRKYSQDKRGQYEKALTSVLWIKKVQDNKITIYETKKQKNLFWISGNENNVSYDKISSTKYIVSIKNAAKNDKLVFSENFSSYWVMKTKTGEVYSTKTINGLNGFMLHDTGNYTVIVEFSYAKHYLYGMIISFCALTIIAIINITLRNKRLQQAI
jgi:hypothetical protein